MDEWRVGIRFAHLFRSGVAVRRRVREHGLCVGGPHDSCPEGITAGASLWGTVGLGIGGSAGPVNQQAPQEDRCRRPHATATKKSAAAKSLYLAHTLLEHSSPWWQCAARHIATMDCCAPIKYGPNTSFWQRRSSSSPWRADGGIDLPVVPAGSRDQPTRLSPDRQYPT